MRQILYELIKGSNAGLISAIPEGTELGSVFLDNRGIAYIDFSSTLSDGHPGGTTAEFMTVSAIVRTLLTNFPEHIRQVQILVEGLEVETLAGHIDISRPLTIVPPDLNTGG